MTNPDQSGMLRFLTDELQAAEDAGQRVWIIGHVLPGKYGYLLKIQVRILWRQLMVAFLLGWDATSALPNGPNLLYQIIDRFSPHVIANVFMGHIHDEVRFLYYKYAFLFSYIFQLLKEFVETMVLLWMPIALLRRLGSVVLLRPYLVSIPVRIYTEYIVAKASN